MSLVHCRECGEMISESAPTCPKCGATQNINSSYFSTTNVDLDPNVGLNIVSFIWPFIGLILYLVYLDKSPRRANACGKWAIIGGVVVVVLALIFVIIYGAFLASILNYS